MWSIPVRSEVFNFAQMTSTFHWNQRTIFHTVPTADVSLRCLLSPCVPLFLRCRLSRLDGVLTYNDSIKNLHKFRQTPVNGLCNSRSPRTCDCYETSLSSHRFLWSVITKSPNFSAGGIELPVHFSATGPRNQGPSAYFAISILREVCEHMMLPWFHSWSRFRDTRLPRACCFWDWSFRSTKCSVNSANHSSRSCTKFHRAGLSDSFNSRVRSESPRARLRSCFDLLPGLCVDSCRVEFCDEDAIHDSAALELDDPLETPGTTMGTESLCSMLFGLSLFSDVMRSNWHYLWSSVWTISIYLLSLLNWKLVLITKVQLIGRKYVSMKWGMGLSTHMSSLSFFDCFALRNTSIYVFFTPFFHFCSLLNFFHFLFFV